MPAARPSTGPCSTAASGASCSTSTTRTTWPRCAELIGRADVFVESFGAGRAERYGLGAEELVAADRDLIVCSITGYGRDGPWRDRPGYDALVAARLGLGHEVDGRRPGPHFLGHPAIAYGTGFLAAIGVLAAARARRVTGSGQLVDVSLLDGALAQTPMSWWWSERGLSFVRRDEGGTAGFGRSRIITDSFECADGEYVMMHSGGEGGFKRSMEVLGLGDRVRDVGGRPELAVPLDDDELEVARVVAPAAFASRTRDEWIELFDAADLAVKPVLRPPEILDDAQVQHAVDDRRRRRPGARTAAPDRPGHRVRRLAGAGADAGAPPGRAPDGGGDGRRRRGAARTGARPDGRLDGALDGVRILDLSSFFATGYGAKLLSDLGADVIKIEPPAGDQLRPFPDPFEACNRGKRSLAIDLRRPDGLAAVERLVATSDVVMHNLRPGKAEKLGLGRDQLAVDQPRPDLRLPPRVRVHRPAAGREELRAAALRLHRPALPGRRRGQPADPQGLRQRRLLQRPPRRDGRPDGAGAPGPHRAGAVRREPAPALQPLRDERERHVAGRDAAAPGPRARRRPARVERDVPALRHRRRLGLRDRRRGP